MTLIQRVHDGVDKLAGWPPLRRHLLRQARRNFMSDRTRNLFFGVHGSWNEAEQAAREFGAVGYDHDSTVDLYVGHTRKDQHDYPALYWILRSMQEGHRSVFDIGGNIGIKYLAFKESLAAWPDLLWRVQDVPAVVRHGRDLARERGEPARLEFTERLEDGDGVDLLYASGVLQYLPRTLGEVLSGYRRLPRRIVINTTAVHAQHAFFTVNNIWTAYCPYRVQTQAGLIGGLTSLGYRLRESWINADKRLELPYQPEYSLGHYSGYCLDLAPGR